MKFFKLVFVIPFLLLSAETALSKTKTTSTAEGKKQAKVENSAASHITSWNLSGAMSAHTRGKGFSASLSWMQRGAGAYQIRMSGPIGSGTVLISKSGGVVTLRDGRKTASSSSAESLLRKQTGISLPVSSLHYWVRGIPAPGAVQSKKYDQAGNLRQLRQAGYTIEYQQYRSAGRAALPSSIRLQGNGVSIRLAVKSWRV